MSKYEIELFQQLHGVESEQPFLSDAECFFTRLLPGVADFHPSSFHRRVRELRRFLKPLRRAVLPELAGDPKILMVDSMLLPVLCPCQVGPVCFEGAAWVRRGAFSVYGGSCTCFARPTGCRFRTS